MASATDPRSQANAPVPADRLRDIGIFGGLSDEVLERFSATLTPLHVMPGEVLFREGDSARELYIVIDGEVEVLKKSRRSRDVRIAILGPNDSFGEMSIIDVQPRSATVRALGPSRLLKMTSEHLDALYRQDLKSYTLITLNIARDLSRRLRVTDGILADFAANLLDEYVKEKK